MNYMNKHADKVILKIERRFISRKYKIGIKNQLACNYRLTVINHQNGKSQELLLAKLSPLSTIVPNSK